MQSEINDSEKMVWLFTHGLCAFALAKLDASPDCSILFYKLQMTKVSVSNPQKTRKNVEF